MEEDLVSKLNEFYRLAKENSLCHNKTGFADLVRKDRTTLSSAFSGSRISKNLLLEIEAVLRDKGVNIVSSGDCSGNFCSSVGVPPKNFRSQDQWFELVNGLLKQLNEKDAQISRLLGIVESFKS